MLLGWEDGELVTAQQSQAPMKRGLLQSGLEKEGQIPHL